MQIFISPALRLGTMEEHKILQQIEFSSLEAFILNQNNYYAHFLKGNPWGEIRRERTYFKRFQDLCPELEEMTTKETCEARSKSMRMPYELLFETYKIMSKLVFVDDECVKTYRYPDRFLTS